MAAARHSIDALADLHVEAHGIDTAKSLAALPVGKSTRETLANVRDPELEATLGYVASIHGSTESGGANCTASYQVGAATFNHERFRVLRPHARGAGGHLRRAGS